MTKKDDGHDMLVGPRTQHDQKFHSCCGLHRLVNKVEVKPVQAEKEGETKDGSNI
jgi:hypothetical protein